MSFSGMGGTSDKSSGQVTKEPASAVIVRAIKALERNESYSENLSEPKKQGCLELLVIQPTPFCNINCSYCYLPDRDNKSKFSLEKLDILFEKLQQASLLDNTLSVSWHAGEPLVMPVEYYRMAIQKIHRLAAGTRVSHYFQTNGILISNEYCEFFKHSGSHVSLSVDGPAFLHDSRRRTRTGSGTHAKAMEGLKRLQDHGVPYSAIAVMSKNSLDYPNEIYDFFRDNGFREFGFNVEELEGANISSSLHSREIEIRYGRFLSVLLERAQRDGRLEWVREFSCGIKSVFNQLQASRPRASENIPFAIVTLDVSGGVYTFSPELAGLDGGKYSIGNIEHLDLKAVWQNEHFLKLNSSVQAGVKLCENSCSYFRVCGGGAPVNKLSENGSFESTETTFCRLRKKVNFDVLESFVLHTLNQRRENRIKDYEIKSPIKVASDLHSAYLLELREKLCCADLSAGELSFPSLEDLSHIEASSGTSRANQPDFENNACLPVEPWRVLTSKEAEIVASRKLSNELWFAQTFKPPNELINPLLSFSSTCGLSVETERNRFEADEELVTVSQKIIELYADSLPYKVLGLGINSPGQLCVTRKPESGERIGLHLDSWFRFSSTKRAHAPNRICINLGQSCRYLMLIDLPLERIIEALDYQATEANMNPTDIGRAFMNAFPNYPVLRIKVAPGHAYVAPTELIIHDGCTEGSHSIDINFTVLGTFRATKFL
jgi:uncharacterized protein